MTAGTAARQPQFHHLTDFSEPIGPPTPGGRIILSDSGRGECVIPASGVSLKYVLDGEEHYQTAYGTAIVRAGEFAVVGPNIPMTAILPRRERTIGLCLYLPDIDNPAVAAGIRPELAVFGAGWAGLGSVLEQMASRLLQRPQLHPEAASHFLDRMRLELSCLADSGPPCAERLHAAKKSTRDDLARRVKVARDYLHLHAGRPVTLVELGRACGISAFHLARTFREAYGVGPGTYHLELRLALAARLLREGHSCSDVAERLGYSEPSSFVRAFKRRYGVTTGRYADFRLVN
jgi:AraC-like DNA-binding protein